MICNRLHLERLIYLLFRRTHIYLFVYIFVVYIHVWQDKLKSKSYNSVFWYFFFLVIFFRIHYFCLHPKVKRTTAFFIAFAINNAFKSISFSFGFSVTTFMYSVSSDWIRSRNIWIACRLFLLLLFVGRRVRDASILFHGH